MRLRVCCVITSEVEKCCLKYKNRGVSRGFYISNNISTPRRLLYNKCANKNIILILQSVNINLTFILLRESKMCQYVVSSAHNPRSLIICRRFVTNFLCVYVKNKIRTCLYTILLIIFCDQISIIGFLSRKINPVLKWWGVTRKSLASHFKEMKTLCSMQYTRSKNRFTIWN